MWYPLYWSALGLLLLAAIPWARAQLWRSRARRRLALAGAALSPIRSEVLGGDPAAVQGTVPAADLAAGPPTALTRWLYLAGYRGRQASRWFVSYSTLCLACGVFVVWGASRTQAYALAARALDTAPGGIGTLFAPIWHAGPWFVAAIIALAPWLIVRRARRQRVAQVERDLPVALELLATLAEAGLGFDAALAAVERALPPGRALASELRTFQADVLAGRGRVECLRRLAWRLDVPAVTVVVSALVQAEQVGAGIAETLRHQADDLRNRRRVLALERSMALPVKLMFPLVICFLPGLFVFTLGPAYAQFFQYADSLIQVRQFGTGMRGSFPIESTP